MNKAKLVNDTLGVKVLNEADQSGLTAIQYSDDKLKQLFIDDLLMNENGQTKIRVRLHNLRSEIVADKIAGKL